MCVCLCVDTVDEHAGNLQMPFFFVASAAPKNSLFTEERSDNVIETGSLSKLNIGLKLENKYSKNQGYV